MMMLAMERFGRTGRGLFLAKLHCLTSSNYREGLQASPPVLLDNEDDDPNGPPAVLKDVPPPSTVI
jgi:hypothetical protein